MVALVLHVGRAGNWKTQNIDSFIVMICKSFGAVEKAFLVEKLAFIWRVHYHFSKQKHQKEPAPRKFLDRTEI